MKQFIYVLRLVERLRVDENWTREDEEIVEEHFQYLKQATDNGIVILAGRTLQTDETGFGIVIFNSEDDAQARDFMNADPSVQKGIMTGDLHPYKIAMLSAKNRTT